LKKKKKFFKIRVIKKRVSVNRIDLKELYKRLFKKLDVVYEKIKKRKRERPKKYKVPDFSLLFYRFKNLNKLIIGYFIKKITFLIKRIEKIKYSLIDATGFGFDESFNLTLLRGKELREVKSHIRLEAIVCVSENNYAFIDRFYLDKAYSNE